MSIRVGPADEVPRASPTMGSVALIPLIPSAAETPERCAAADGPRILKFWHLASMDAPSVAVVCA
ncbi:MAG: hypothetical protein WBX09_02505, partial [Terracidiphilus sp.]